MAPAPAPIKAPLPALPLNEPMAAPVPAPVLAPAGEGGLARWLVQAPVAVLFVLFTFGGWSDGAYISAELRERYRRVTRRARRVVDRVFYGNG